MPASYELVSVFVPLSGLGGGGDALESASRSAVVEVCEEVWTKIHSVHWLKDEAMRSESKRQLKEAYLPVVLAKLEAQTDSNNSDNGWICTSSKVCAAIFKDI